MISAPAHRACLLALALNALAFLTACGGSADPDGGAYAVSLSLQNDAPEAGSTDLATLTFTNSSASVAAFPQFEVLMPESLDASNFNVGCAGTGATLGTNGTVRFTGIVIPPGAVCTATFIVGVMSTATVSATPLSFGAHDFGSATLQSFVAPANFEIVARDKNH